MILGEAPMITHLPGEVHILPTGGAIEFCMHTYAYDQYVLGNQVRVHRILYTHKVASEHTTGCDVIFANGPNNMGQGMK